MGGMAGGGGYDEKIMALLAVKRGHNPEHPID
jgi:hypothetical protein